MIYVLYLFYGRCQKCDVVVQLYFLDFFNGKFFFLSDVWEMFNILELYIDLVGFRGYGVVFGKYWLYGRWFFQWYYLNIVIFDLFLIVIVLYIWGLKILNKSIFLFIDNVVFGDIINK